MLTKEKTELLSLDALKIGFVDGRKKRHLLPAIEGFASGGELIAVIGRNGIGKSTLLRTITGLQPMLSGMVWLKGKEINKYSGRQLAKQIGYVSTELINAGNLRVYDLVSLGRFSYTNWFGKVDPVSHNSIVDALEKTGLHEFSARMISELSDGERQRAMIAMILAQDPEIMVMDEPAVFLDIKNKYEIFHLIRNLSRKKNKTIIFSTHDLHSAINMADKVWLMLDEGLCQGAPEDLMIKGAFNDLFGNTGFSYDPRYEKDQEKEKKLTGIYIDGTGDYKYWTEKAVARAGLHVSAEKTEIIVKTPSEKIMKWVLRDVTGEYEFESIYEMIKWISR